MNEGMVAQELAELVGELSGLPSRVDDDSDRVDVITALEKVKAAVAAAQLSVVADFAASQEAANRALGVEARAARRGVPEQVGLARRVAPATAARQLTQARALQDDLPETFALLSRGGISEWVATIVVTETSHLAAEDRRLVDKKLAAQLGELSPRRAQALVRKLTIEADPAGAVKRAGNARKDRRVTSRPAPDTMAMLSALLPCEQGVAAYAALRRHADGKIAAGDERTRNQIMADTLVERLTGQATAEDVDAEIGLIMSDSTLFGGDDEPADMTDYGPVPADIARDIAARAANDSEAGADAGATSAADSEASATSASKAAEAPGAERVAAGIREVGAAEPGPVGTLPATGGWSVAGYERTTAPAGADESSRARVWIRRLFTDPVTGIIIDCDPRRRRFDGILAKLLVYRDQQCRDPYCDAPIRHLDHIAPHAAGGPTTSINGRGVCERGNYVRQMPGWAIKLIDPDGHIVETTTPTGHTYRSRAPAAPGTRRQPVPV